MIKDWLSFKGIFGGALLAVLGAGLLPACGSSSHSGTGGVGGSIGAGGTVGGGGSVGTCGAELIPNDTRDTATAYALGTPVTACLGTGTDVDMYSFTVPTVKAAGGFVRFSFTEVSAIGDLDLKLFSAADNSQVDEIYTISSGASLDGYLAVAAGQTYRIAVSDFAGGSPVRYTMNIAYTGLDDLYEPNDTKDAAKPIAVGTPITAFLAAGYVEDPYQGIAFADWYSVVLPAGPTTVKMTTVPTDIMGDIQMFTPDGDLVDEKYSTTGGANVTLTAVVAVPGTYTIQITPFSGAAKPSGETVAGVPPDHFTRPYTLTVSQP